MVFLWWLHHKIYSVSVENYCILVMRIWICRCYLARIDANRPCWRSNRAYFELSDSVDIIATLEIVTIVGSSVNKEAPFHQGFIDIIYSPVEFVFLIHLNFVKIIVSMVLTISWFLHFCLDLATYWHLYKCCGTYLLIACTCSIYFERVRREIHSL